jgi:glutamine synthetase
MQILQNVARRYRLVCLLHEKPFAGVNGSGKHNNWSMGTDTGVNLLDPGDTPHQNLSFLFFCTAVIKAVDTHQKLLRASIAGPGQDHRLGANEAPPAIISIFLGAELQKIYDAIETGSGDAATPQAWLGLGASVLPRLPMHGGDRNRTSPFAFTGNKFEFRALGSSQSLGLPNTVLNTIAAEAIDALAAAVRERIDGGSSLEEAILAVVKDEWAAHKRVVFDGDGYSEEWHAEAEQRGLANLRTTPDALPHLVADETVAAFEHYDVLTRRELEARLEILAEQYTTKINIEGETAAQIARTMIIPATVQHLARLRAAGDGGALGGLIEETTGLLDELVGALRTLEERNLHHPDDSAEVLEHARYVRDQVVPAMDATRAAADKLERIVSDDLWPLPKYSEVLFIK